MPTDHVTAHDLMRSRFFLAWNDWLTNGKPVDIRNTGSDREDPIVIQDSTGAGYIPEIFWLNVERKESIDYSRHWCRFISDPVTTRQTSLRTASPQAGSRKTQYTEKGIIIVQMFFSKSAFDKNIDRKLSAIARDIFRPRNVSGNPVWYHNADIRYLTPEERWFRSNVIAEYQFDEHL